MRGVGWISGLLFASFGCNASPTSGSGSCVPFTPCGGDLVGDWVIEGTCGVDFPSDVESNSSCPGWSTEVVDVDITGTISFLSDGTFYIDFSVFEQLTYNVPVECLASDGLSSCAEFADVLDGSSSDDGAITFDRFSCSEGSVCVCDARFTVDAAGSESYSVSGAEVDQGNDGEVDWRYCVKDDVLRLENPDTQAVLVLRRL